MFKICIHEPFFSCWITWEIGEGIFAAISLGDGTSELLQDVVELRGALQRPMLRHTQALFQGMELPLVRYQLLYKETEQKEKEDALARNNMSTVCPGTNKMKVWYKYHTLTSSETQLTTLVAIQL